ncbi:MAG: hypothetical protein O3C20_17995 [Verrucomicrobia bacterium]|nr:hypothetical protein [Verrucomicrobiota bacterium]
MELKDQAWVKRLIATNPPLAVFWYPWYWRGGHTIRFRKLTALTVWNRSGGAAKAGLILKALLWPFVALLSGVLSFYINSSSIKQTFGTGRWRQWCDMIRLSFWWGLSPDVYYSQRLYLWNLDEDAIHVLSSYETSLICIELGRGTDTELVNNKYRFFKFCKENDIGTVPVLAAFEKGKQVYADFSGTFPKSDLYLKPSEGVGGKGIERWVYRLEGDCWAREEVRMSEKELLDYFISQSQNTDYILQEAAQNHPDISKYSPGSLVTFRVGTLMGPEGDPELLNCHIVIALGETEANHGSYGGFNANFDLETEKFHYGIGRLPKLRIIRTHPVTGATIEGADLPCWPELRELALKGHRLLPQIKALGWDLAFTTRGAEVVECNTQWGLMPGTVLGKTNFIKYHLQALENS